MSGASVVDLALSTGQGVGAAVLPLMAILATLQLLFLRLPSSHVRNLLKGAAISAIGLWIFLVGVQIGFMPFGRAIGEALGGLARRWQAIPVGLLLGFITAWSEPAVRVLCGQVEQASGGSIRSRVVLVAICTGVACMVALAVARVVYGIPLLAILIPGYVLGLVLMWCSDRDFVGVAFDAGGAATGPMANTFLLGLGLGLASAQGEQSLMVSGLGLVALIALAPIISVLGLGVVIRVASRRRG